MKAEKTGKAVTTARAKVDIVKKVADPCLSLMAICVGSASHFHLVVMFTFVNL